MRIPRLLDYDDVVSLEGDTTAAVYAGLKYALECS